MKEFTVSIGYPDYSITRRNFLRLVAFGGLGFLLSACGENQPNQENENLKSKLKEKLDLPTNFTREQLAGQSAAAIYNPNWNINTFVGNFSSQNGVVIPIHTNEFGELADIQLDRNKPSDVKAYNSSRELRYPTPPKQVTSDTLFKTALGQGEADTHIIVYGTQGTVARLKPEMERVFRQPLAEMFGFLETDIIAVHLNFMPPTTVKYEDIAQLGYIPSSDRFTAHTHMLPYDGNNPYKRVKRLDVYLNMYQHHVEQKIFGLTHQENFESTFVNEVDGILGLNKLTYDPRVTFLNEAHSTLMAWLAVVEPDIVPTVLGGGGIEQAIEIIGKEMDVLAKIGSQ